MNSQFLEFELGKYAMFGFEENGPADYHFASKGDTNGDGEPDAFSKTNMKVVFVRNDDHTVNAYVFYAEQGSKPAKLAVYSEEAVLDGKVAASNAGTYSTYKFDLKWADPNTEAKITSLQAGKLFCFYQRQNHQCHCTLQHEAQRLSTYIHHFRRCNCYCRFHKVGERKDCFGFHQRCHSVGHL